MSLDLFRINGGIDITNEAYDSNANILQGIGAPGGDSGVQDDAPIGSLYLRTDASGDEMQVYYKWNDLNALSDWQLMPSKNYVDSVAAGLSWREPVVVLDPVSTTLPTGTAGNPTTVDGISILGGDRVLFSNVTTGKNVYIYNQATGLFEEDVNQESDGDALFVQSGTRADQQWIFDGTNWILFGTSVDSAELAFLRDFIGKNGLGAEFPTFTSQFAITNNDNLEVAIEKLDTTLGSGAITNDGGNYALSDDLAFTGTNGANGTLTLTGALNDLNEAIGSRDYTTGAGYFLADGQTVTASLEALNVGLYNSIVNVQLVNGSIATTPATFQTLDSIPVADATQIKWMVQIRDTATPSSRRASEIHAIHDGSVVDYTRYAELKLGAALAGYGLQVIISGGNVVLQGRATNAYDYAVKRIAINDFA
jgi:hypothetical protein